MSNMISRQRSLVRAAVFLVLAVLAGCDLGKTRIVRVHGRVTRGGQPVPNLFLNFLPAEGRPSWGVTNERGHFILHYDKSRDGAVPGTHTIFVAFKGWDPREKKVIEQGRYKIPQDIFAILAKYGDQETTPLTRVLSQDDQEIDLELD
jgi:hypothetical protein